ncbi:MAG: hypothetical protein C4541_13570 [Candidatus Auribacter fodinae]|uniref:Uncharacterized protein n=1 Tax=Candidatus Auribacter fodinae TaxID=2093366 RepID=A0A3A4QZM5_9BACT|nr:MAG: hypothetical protein C4541_13570 [Candidatus Auribacter fodinae]
MNRAESAKPLWGFAMTCSCDFFIALKMNTTGELSVKRKNRNPYTWGGMNSGLINNVILDFIIKHDSCQLLSSTLTQCITA